MTNKTILLLALVVCIKIGNINAQEAWTLERCINYAFENNITIKRQNLSTDLQKNELSQSKLNRLPNLNSQSTYGHSYGYTWIQEAGQNVDVNTRSFSLGIGSSVDVFDGLSVTNTIKRNRLDLMASLALEEEIRNDIALQITSQYLQILFDKELLLVAQEQYEVTSQQVRRTQQLVEAGSLAKGSQLEIKSQAAKEALNVTQQENNLNLSLLNLAQLLDLEDVANFDVVSPIIPEIAHMKVENPVDVYSTALTLMPQIKGADYQLESSIAEVKIARGGYYPNLSLNAQWGARANWLIDDPNNLNRSLSDQINSNKNFFVGASLNIPIFNKLQTRSRVKNARIAVLDAQYQLNQQKLNLRKEIQQAYADALGAYNKYLSSSLAVESFKESLRYTEQKYNVGLVNTVDYNVAKNDYLRAQSDLLQSKYEYILRSKILDFYKGIAIVL
ncbi:outer membrane protein [Saccharicrinis carchari]|uniref:Outer membrane protein n=1 Tax=Saccharicrinis carchari TaxID=1168039 RepID=A0A521BVU5_SACCC|nr:TolC family protein [Saccharicrinis carchari]SMO51314.1 outer membrane protein [Saccharicrinis carchari]